MRCFFEFGNSMRAIVRLRRSCYYLDEAVNNIVGVHMGKRSKLLERLEQMPRDFTFHEARSLPESFK